MIFLLITVKGYTQDFTPIGYLNDYSSLDTIVSIKSKDNVQFSAEWWIKKYGYAWGLEITDNEEYRILFSGNKYLTAVGPMYRYYGTGANRKEVKEDIDYFFTLYFKGELNIKDDSFSLNFTNIGFSHGRSDIVGGLTHYGDFRHHKCYQELQVLQKQLVEYLSKNNYFEIEASKSNQ